MDRTTLISLILLTLFIGLSLSRLLINTLKEGKEALEEMKKDSK